MNQFLEKPEVGCLDIWDKNILTEGPPSAKPCAYGVFNARVASVMWRNGRLALKRK